MPLFCSLVASSVGFDCFGLRFGWGRRLFGGLSSDGFSFQHDLIEVFSLTIKLTHLDYFISFFTVAYTF